jgi:sulfite exporter TauE/SafE
MSRTLSYILIIIGGFVAIYAQARAEQNQLILIAGIVILMLGVYNISRNIPSKKDQEDEHQNNL